MGPGRVRAEQVWRSRHQRRYSDRGYLRRMRMLTPRWPRSPLLRRAACKRRHARSRRGERRALDEIPTAQCAGCRGRSCVFRHWLPLRFQLRIQCRHEKMVWRRLENVNVVFSRSATKIETERMQSLESKQDRNGHPEASVSPTRQRTTSCRRSSLSGIQNRRLHNERNVPH